MQRKIPAHREGCHWSLNPRCRPSSWLEQNKVQCCPATVKPNLLQRRLSAHFLSIMVLYMLFRCVGMFAFPCKWNKFYDKLNSKIKLWRFWFIFTLQRNPFFPKNFLTIGDWTARVRKTKMLTILYMAVSPQWNLLKYHKLEMTRPLLFGNAFPNNWSHLKILSKWHKLLPFELLTFTSSSKRKGWCRFAKCTICKTNL